jgi:peptidoglycan biosynthesis protein MviN/MurJ (putative lipid II flippase)
MNVILNLVLDVGFGLTLGAAGIALSSSLTAIVVLIFFATRLTRSGDDFLLVPIARTLLLALSASLPVAVPIGVLCWLGIAPGGLVPGLLALASFGVLGLLGYGFIAVRLGLEEARGLAGLVAGWLSRRRGDARASG